MQKRAKRKKKCWRRRRPKQCSRPFPPSNPSGQNIIPFALRSSLCKGIHIHLSSPWLKSSNLQISWSTILSQSYLTRALSLISEVADSARIIRILAHKSARPRAIQKNGSSHFPSFHARNLGSSGRGEGSKNVNLINLLVLGTAILLLLLTCFTYPLAPHCFTLEGRQGPQQRR